MYTTFLKRRKPNWEATNYCTPLLIRVCQDPGFAPRAGPKTRPPQDCSWGGHVSL